MPTPCPTADALARFAGGELDDAALEPIGAHLDGCAACRAVVDAVPELVAAAAVPSDAESAIRRVTELVLLVPPPPSDGSGFAATPDPLPERFDRFRVVGRLGAGAMGVVYEAEDEQLGRRVAVKVLRAAFAARPGSRDRFLREARAVAALRHPNVVAIHHVGAAGDVPFLVMELLAGESLGARVRNGGAVAPADAVRIGREVAAGLAAVHAAGLVHRDVTPDNVWLTADGPAKLLDFGLVRADGDAVVTHPGTIVGTPRYMAPEQARADAADPRSDVFGLGAVLFYALTAAYPFPGDDVLAVLAAHASHTPPPADRVNRAVPRRVAHAVGRMLEKDPARRPQSAADAAALLAESLVPRRPRWPVAALVVLLVAGGVWAMLPPAPSIAPDPIPAPAPTPLPPDEPPLPADPDRAFAERALDGTGNALIEIRVGGEIRQLTTHPKGIMGPVDARADLPAGPFAVVVANLNRHRTFGDADVALLRGLRHVTILQLTNVRITDAALPHLRHATKLESLFLYATGVTDDGLPHLNHLAELRQLSFRQTRVTEAGVRRLSAALPRCRMEWNGGIVGPLE